MDNKKNNSILLTIIGVATLLVALVGATFAYFSATATSEAQTVDTGKLTIASTYGTAKNNTNIIPTTFASYEDPTGAVSADNSILNKTLTTEELSTIDANKNIAQFPVTINWDGTDVRGAKYDLTLTGAVIQAGSTADADLTGAETSGGTRTDVTYALVDGNNKVVTVGTYDETGAISKQLVKEADITVSENAEDNQETYVLYVFINETNKNQDKLQNTSVSATVVADAYTPKTGA